MFPSLGRPLLHAMLECLERSEWPGLDSGHGTQVSFDARVIALPTYCGAVQVALSCSSEHRSIRLHGTLTSES